MPFIIYPKTRDGVPDLVIIRATYEMERITRILDESMIPYVLTESGVRIYRRLDREIREDEWLKQHEEHPDLLRGT